MRFFLSIFSMHMSRIQSRLSTHIYASVLPVDYRRRRKSVLTHIIENVLWSRIQSVVHLIFLILIIIFSHIPWVFDLFEKFPTWNSILKWNVHCPRECLCACVEYLFFFIFFFTFWFFDKVFISLRSIVCACVYVYLRICVNMRVHVLFASKHDKWYITTILC